MSLLPLASNSPSPPHLEFYQSGSTELQRVSIEHTPFKIGRCETSDLQIDSAQVSREHAQIYRRGNIWAIRDLGSTNGTQVNGKPVRESFLSDGDILGIAETEVAFVASSVTPLQRMATQPIQPKESTRLPALLPVEIAHIRALTEATLWQAIPVKLASIVTIDNGETEASFVSFTEPKNVQDTEFNAFHVMSNHYRKLARIRAVELARSNTHGSRMFVTADLAELESPKQLCLDLEQLKDQLGVDVELGVMISLPRIHDPSMLEGACREIRQADLLLGFFDFQGGSGQILELASCAPDYLVLCESMLKGLQSGNQSLRRLEQVFNTCKEFHIKAVLPARSSQHTVEQCRKIGYEFSIETTRSHENAAFCHVICTTS